MTTKEILAIKMEENDAGSADIGEYLSALLETLWSEGEEFNSKKPFGNSGWGHEIYCALVQAKVVEGTFDKEGDLDACNYKQADELILNCIRRVLSIR